ncbi:MAG: nitrilase, partial [Calditrichaeota bacterium]|nr:nitrilase [Calditrichota bacterium]
VIQDAPVLFERGASTEKACRLIAATASEGAKLVLLPEAFIPAYPRGLTFGTVVGQRSPAGRRIWQRYWENSLEV